MMNSRSGYNRQFEDERGYDCGGRRGHDFEPYAPSFRWTEIPHADLAPNHPVQGIVPAGDDPDTQLELEVAMLTKQVAAAKRRLQNEKALAVLKKQIAALEQADPNADVHAGGALAGGAGGGGHNAHAGGAHAGGAGGADPNAHAPFVADANAELGDDPNDPYKHSPAHIGQWQIIPKDAAHSQRWSQTSVKNELGQSVSARKILVSTLIRFFGPLPDDVSSAMLRPTVKDVADALNATNFAIQNVQDVLFAL